jgi:hypothetical protein
VRNSARVAQTFALPDPSQPFEDRVRFSEYLREEPSVIKFPLWPFLFKRVDHRLVHVKRDKIGSGRTEAIADGELVKRKRHRRPYPLIR